MYLCTCQVPLRMLFQPCGLTVWGGVAVRFLVAVAGSGKVAEVVCCLMTPVCTDPQYFIAGRRSKSIQIHPDQKNSGALVSWHLMIDLIALLS